MAKVAAFVLVCALAVSMAAAHGEEKIGVLIDAKCAESLAGDPSKAEAHPTSCALEGSQHGYGILVEGKFLRFDEYGNKQALLLLKATDRKSNLKVRVGGHFEQDLVKVSEIETVE